MLSESPLMIAALSSMTAATPAQAGFLEDVGEFFEPHIQNIQKAADNIKDQLDKKGIEVDQNVKGDQAQTKTIEGELGKLTSLKGEKLEKVGDDIFQTKDKLVVVTALDAQTAEFDMYSAEQEAGMLGADRLADHLKLKKDSGVTLRGMRNVGKIVVVVNNYLVQTRDIGKMRKI